MTETRKPHWTESIDWEKLKEKTLGPREPEPIFVSAKVYKILEEIRKIEPNFMGLGGTAEILFKAHELGIKDE